MPKKAKDLTAIEVKRITQMGLTRVGNVAGLALSVSKTGARSWKIRIMIGDKRRDLGLGGYPDVSLKEAIEKARALREKIDQGIDPVAEKEAARLALKAEQAKLMTFKYCAEQVIKIKEEECRNKKHAAQWRSTLESYAYPVLGNLAVRDIELAHIVEVLQEQWTVKNETMSRVRGRIEKVLSWAKANGYREGENPAQWRGNLDAVLPAPSKIQKVKHHEALGYEDMYDFMQRLRAIDSVPARALEFTALTGSRIGSVIQIRWSEIDLDKKIWIVPDEHMKMGKEHRVPLSTAAIRCLERLPHMDSPFVFTITGRKGVSDTSVTNVRKELHATITTHGFRSTVMDWAGDCTSWPIHVVRMALSHAIKDKVEAAYRRRDMLEKRARFMQQWADFIDTKPAKGNVTPIGKVNHG